MTLYAVAWRSQGICSYPKANNAVLRLTHEGIGTYCDDMLAMATMSSTLAERVRSRRLELGLSQTKAAALGDVSHRTWVRVELEGFTDLRELTRAGIERALQWEAGTVTRLIHSEWVADHPDHEPPPGAPALPIAAASGQVPVTREEFDRLEEKLDRILELASAWEQDNPFPRKPRRR